MSEDSLGIKAREALRHIRNFLMQHGRMPSIRELMKEMKYKSPLSPMLLLNELAANDFLEKKPDGSYILLKDLTARESARTVAIPLVGTASCGMPILAQENIEADDSGLNQFSQTRFNILFIESQRGFDE